MAEVTPDFPDFPVSMAQMLVGKTIATIEQHPDADEGFCITFTDGSWLRFGFSGCEGDIQIGGAQ